MSRPLVLAGLIAVIAALFAVQLSTQRAGAAMPPASPLTQTFTGNVISKIGPNNPGATRPVSITTKSVAGLGSSGGFNGFISEVVVTSTAGSPAEGDVRLNTAVTASSWSRSTAVKSKFQLLTPSAASAEVYTKGAWRPLRRDTQKDTVVAYFVGDGGRLQIFISGLVHNGTTTVAVEIMSATSNDSGFGFGNVSSLDAMPLAVGSIPANGGVAATTVTPSFLMSENVTGAPSAFTLTCNNVPVPFTLTGLNTDTIGLDPVSDLTPGASCVATVNMAQVSDSDSADPPQNGVGTEQFTFTVDLPPSVTNATPTVLAATDVNTVFTFSEPVLMSAQSFTINCGAGNLAFLLTTNAQKTVATLNPLVDLPGGATCTVTVIANKISDIDTADPLDNMVANYVHVFGTDAAPFVTAMTMGVQQSTQGPPTPTWHFELGAQNSSESSIEITFSEAVNLANNAMVVLCNGQPAYASLASSGMSATIEPASSWPAGAFCSGTIYATLTTDTDVIDPPNNMAQNVTFNFGIDAAPTVVSGSSAGNPPLITVVFSEPVSVLMFTMVCNSDPVIPVANSVDGGTTWTFDNSANSETFEEGQTCVFTIPAGMAVDSDFVDPPDGTTADYVLTINTDDPPVVTSVTVDPNDTQCSSVVLPPLNSGCAIGDPLTSTTPTFTVNFSEPVNVASTAAGYSLSCTPSGGSLLGGTGTNLTMATVTASGITPGAECTFTVLAAGVADSDLNDPPNNPLANFPFVFEVDEAPEVLSSVPNDGSQIGDSSDTVEITFSEPVNISGGTSFICGADNRFVSVTTINFVTWTVAYSSLVADQGETCTLTIVAANITDSDAVDPPQNPVANVVLVYNVDEPPALVSISPDDSDVIQTQAITLTFSELVVVDPTDWDLECNAVPFTDFTVSPAVESSTLTYVFTPDTVWPAGSLCIISILATDVIDADGADTPENPESNISESFTTDSAPTVELIETVDDSDNSETLLDGGSVQASDDVRVTFSELVDVGAGWLTITCTTPVHSYSASAVVGANTVFTVTPTAIPDGATGCVLTVVATAVTDDDEVDAPDQMAANETRSLVSDTAPEVLSTFPVTASTIGDNSDTSDTFEITFSEAVTLDPGAVELTCDAETITVTNTATLDDITFTIEYASLATYHDESCTLTVVATAVHDNDGVDGPDEMVANFTATFTVDTAPAFLGSLPVQATVSISQVITLQFNESVNIADGFVFITCDSASFTDFTVSSSPDTDFDITPTTGWPVDATCDIDIAAIAITDDDEADTPDVPAAAVDTTFTTDAAPTVTSFNRTFPSTTELLEDSDTVGSTDGIDVFFSEFVVGDAGWLTITCDLESYSWIDTLGFTENLTQAVDPTDFPAGANCTATVDGTKIHDTDEVDDPYDMATSPSVSFVVDAAPEVLSSTIVDEQEVGSDTTEISVTFTEEVTAGSASLSCVSAGSISISVTVDTGTTIQFDFLSALTPGDICTFTILAADVVDTDAFDPPDIMATDFVIDFTVAEPV